MAQLEFGIVYNRHWSDGIPLKEFAELGEQFGFDALWCSENTFSPLPKIEAEGWLQPGLRASPGFGRRGMGYHNNLSCSCLPTFLCRHRSEASK